MVCCGSSVYCRLALFSGNSVRWLSKIATPTPAALPAWLVNASRELLVVSASPVKVNETAEAALPQFSSPMVNATGWEALPAAVVPLEGEHDRLVAVGDAPAGGFLDELGEGKDGGDQGVVEQEGIAGPDRADAFFRESVDQGEALVVAAREEGDGKAVEMGNGLLEFLDEVGRAGNGRGAVFILLEFG